MSCLLDFFWSLHSGCSLQRSVKRLAGPKRLAAEFRCQDRPAVAEKVHVGRPGSGGGGRRWNCGKFSGASDDNYTWVLLS